MYLLKVKKVALSAQDDKRIQSIDSIKTQAITQVVTELLNKGGKLNMYSVFVTQFYFFVSKNIRLNSTHYFVKKISKKQELQQIAYNHSSDTDFKAFMNLQKKCTEKKYFSFY